MVQGPFVQNSIAAIHPIVLIYRELGRNLPSLSFVSFFGLKFPALAFAVWFYICAGVLFFFLAEYELRPRVGTPMNRLPVLVIFAVMEFFFLGFFANKPSSAYAYQYLENLKITFIFHNMLSIGMLYAFIMQSVKTFSEIKPWLYRVFSRGFKPGDLIESDSPAIFTVVLLIVEYMFSLLILTLVFHNELDIISDSYYFRVGSTSISWILFIEIATVTVIALRDALFFQVMQIMHKKGRQLGILIYILAFGAVPLLILFANQGHPIVDLSPVTAISSFNIAIRFSNYKTLFYTYLGINFLLIILFGSMLLRFFKKAQTGLMKDIPERVDDSLQAVSNKTP